MKRILAVLALAAAGAALTAWFVSAPRPAFEASRAAELEQKGDPDKGKLVFYAGGCASCHAIPGQDDRLKLGGGLEMHSPFGTFVAPNISPHKRDGIGDWRVIDLANAMVSGVSPKGEHYYPAFPYTSYHLTKTEDVRDLMAFIRTLEPVEGRARDHAMAFPFNIRRSLGLWKAMFFDTTPLQPDASKSASWNRGRYLVEGLGHCAECHTSRHQLGGPVRSEHMAGGPDPEGKGWVPNITPHANGLARWSQKEIADLLKTGFTAEYDAVGGSMASVVKNMAQLPPEDVAAISEYLATLPGRPGPARPKKAAQ